MRGWLHAAILALGLALVRSACTSSCTSFRPCASHFLGCDVDAALASPPEPTFAPALAARLRGRGAPALLFLQWTLLGYTGSANFHLVPYTSRWHYNLALAGDLASVALGSLAPLLVWTSAAAPPLPNPWPRSDEAVQAVAGVGPVDLAAGVGVALVLGIIAMLGRTVSRRRQVLEDYRAPRLFSQLLVLCLQTFVEFWSCWGVPELRPVVLALLVLKAACPAYFVALARHDAAGKARWPAMTWSGVWEHHEHFHLLSAVAHGTQLYLVLAASEAAANAG